MIWSIIILVAFINGAFMLYYTKPGKENLRWRKRVYRLTIVQRPKAKIRRFTMEKSSKRVLS